MSWRWAGSCSGSRASQRRAASTASSQWCWPIWAVASRSSVPASSRRSRSAWKYCQSSKLVLSRRLNPARKSPRCSPAAAASGARQAGQASSGGWPWSRRPASSASNSAHVQPEAGPGEPDGGPVRGQPPRPDGLVQGRQGAPQRPPGVLGVVVGPEQPGHGVAAVPLGVHGQVGQQGDRLAGVDLDRRPVPLHPRRPQQRDPQLRHAPPFPLPPSAVSMARPGPAVTDSVTMPERWDGTTALKEVP